tara:strand:- start:115 stop:348 length:234 start_codon:yes stop_codon:yes gene_type:complete
MSYIKEAEDGAVKTVMSGQQKKEIVLGLIKNNLPRVYDEHTLLIDCMIDAFVLISNNPKILQAQGKCINSIFLCCGC